jgi:hypothetical protein
MAPIPIAHDYYAILRVSNTASLDVVKQSYHRLALDLHPDKNPNDPNATAAFQLVSLGARPNTVFEVTFELIIWGDEAGRSVSDD